jgi:hypothetical protein
MSYRVRSMNRHLAPEELVDLLESTPVEAEVRRHFDDCVECRRQLRELEETLGVLRADVRSPSVLRRSLPWLAAAAAIVAAIASFYPGSPPSPEVSEIELLSPLGEDAEYRILEAFSGDLSEGESLAAPAPDFADSSDLTDSERRELLERIANEMEKQS